MHPRQSSPRQWDRRQVVCALLAAALPASVARAQGDDMVTYVRDLYLREIELHNSRAPVSNQAFFALFARDMRALMQAPRPNAGREPIGHILHAFFGWGILPGRQVKFVQAVAADGGQVRVDLDGPGGTRQIMVRPVREKGLWKIADISYGSDDSLRTYYKRITGR